LRRPAPLQGRNPRTGQPIILHATEDAAEVVWAGRSVGSASWSLSEEPLVNVSVAPDALFLVREWAAALGGEFQLGTPGA
jgi:hypothetical protein